ncbi:uncharacterized protein AMSG_03646 [Thecamonas trahens ATCC 50062]|uniref:Nuclear pore protein n=1 Tax=Thecamonas trahens ATCC 50062 TaxID=461836 RepID=A0A0L0D7E4_THETB|nr:hypothetical protein AMSG_03646 [Thecamonas trahens ATCC 50062]KNC47218.1 hypothetical protein AMSG_03646 [Thecamonas trahens ATCC 50062]|eukprot:XP_013759987.1 hypothetical protein AMSG_03646 [Thecamonas trahens ATCC 50062]
MQRQLIEGARRFFEQQYRSLLVAYVGEQHDAYVGGEPDLLAVIKTFIETKFAGNMMPNLETVDGYPLYAGAYLCLRCGAYGELLQLAQTKGDRWLVSIVSAFVNTRATGEMFPPSLRDDVKSMAKMASATPDVYKQALCAVIAQYAQPLDEVLSTAQDYVWFKLMLVDTSSDATTSPDANSLPALIDVQREFTGYASSGHFASLSPYLTFQIFLGVQLFDDALTALGSDPAVVACALALTHYGISTPVVHNIVLRSARSLAKSAPGAALHYYLVLAPSNRDEYIKELLLDNPELLPALKPIRKLSADDIREYTKAAAGLAENKMRISDALALYFAAGEAAKVVDLLVRHLARSLSALSRDRASARELAEHYAVKVVEASMLASIDADLVASFNRVVLAADALDAAQSSSHESTLEILDSLGMFPTQQADLNAAVAAFAGLHDALKAILPELLVAAMSAISALYAQARSPAVKDALRERAHLLSAFVGLVDFKLPGDVSTRLLRMEVALN